MKSLDDVSLSIGRLQSEMASLQYSVNKLSASVDALLAFRWKVAGMMTLAGGLVEGLHILISVKG